MISYLCPAILVAILTFTSCRNQDVAYVCPPCDQSCDDLTFDSPGICPYCKMTLIKKTNLLIESNLELNHIDIAEGSGVFLIEGGRGKEEETIKVYYYRPKYFSEASKILMVIPGAGRSADDYRDAWKLISEEHNVLIVSLNYDEESYPFEDYHLCGMIKSLNLQQSIEYIEGTNQVRLNDDDLSFEVNRIEEEWLFNDFDRIFDLVIASTQTNQATYDIFGHSAGGQILHRAALLSKSSKANTIVAANSGFYTLPDTMTGLPFGVLELGINNEDLSNAFSKKLIVMAGELDNANETKGTLLRSDIADQQGLHRLARAHHFYKTASNIADQINSSLEWKLVIVPGVGHNQAMMAKAASQILYE